VTSEPTHVPADAVADHRPAHRRRLLIGAASLSVVAAAAGIALWQRDTSATRDGSAVLALVLPDLAGHDQPLAPWRGKVRVVNFWATWCAPCRDEMPHFVSVQTRDGVKGVQFVGIAVDQADKVREFANEIGVNYPVLIGGFGAIELSKSLGNDLAALPFTVVVDRAGHVAHTQLGPLKAAQLDRLLQGLLPAA
jgi:thiol-disulfide isomerase/thioredoxin